MLGTFKNIHFFVALWYNFEQYRPGQASPLGEQYDKQSIMHYGK